MLVCLYVIESTSTRDICIYACNAYPVDVLYSYQCIDSMFQDAQCRRAGVVPSGLSFIGPRRPLLRHDKHPRKNFRMIMGGFCAMGRIDRLHRLNNVSESGD
jgi:hypothetical protein